jgi:hypothetical protein
MVQFAVGLEPVAVYRGGRRGPLLHARVDDTAALSGAEIDELADWLGELGIKDVPDELLVTHDGAGAYRLNLDGQAVDVDYEALPEFLRS